MGVVYSVSEIFTPSSPAKLTFVEREAINRRVVRALKTPGTQIIIYGQSGSGKTTLIENKLFQVYERHLKTSCTKGMGYDAVILDAFDQLSSYYLSKKSFSTTDKENVELSARFEAIKASLNSEKSSEKTSDYNRVVPPQLTAQSLARFMGAAGYCWILDDFHKIEDEDKQKLSQLMKVFVDMSIEFPDLKIVCVGAVNTARQVVQYDKEMSTRVSEIKVPLMQDFEIASIMKKGFGILGLEVVDDSIYSDVFHYTNGLASICHKLCLLICESLGVSQTIEFEKDDERLYIENPSSVDWSEKNNKKMIPVDLSELGSDVSRSDSGRRRSVDVVEFANLAYAVKEYLEDASDTIRTSFDSAFQVDSGPIVLEALSEGGEDGECIDGISEILQEMNVRFEDDDLRNILSDLQSESGGSIISYDPYTYSYRFSNPFLMAFARSIFEHSSYKPRMTQGELVRLLHTAFRSMQKEY